MIATRKQYSAEFKARVAIGAIRGEKTLSQLGPHFGVHPVQVAHWRGAALEHLQAIFVDERWRKGRGEEVEKRALDEEIGRQHDVVALPVFVDERALEPFARLERHGSPMDPGF